MKYFIPAWVVRAAEMRAQGGSINAAADAAGKTANRLLHWIRGHKPQWFAALQSARRETRDAACDEAIAMLRKQLRDKEAKSIYQAAASLSKTFKSNQVKQPGAARPSPDDDPLREWMNAVPSGVTNRVDLHIQASEEESRAAALAGDASSDQH